MTKIINGEDLLKHSFTQCVLDAFGHLDFVREIKRTNNWRQLLDGYSLTNFSEGDMSFEEYFVRNLFKKVSNVEVQGVDPELNTLLKFNSFLALQEVSHIRVSSLLDQIDDSTSIGRVLLRTRSMFHEIFADFNEFQLKPRFTSGSTLTLSKTEGTSPFSRFKASEGSEYLRGVFERRRKQGIYRFSVTDQAFPQTKGDDSFYVQLMTVPKEWSVLRIIGKTPSSVLACQAGLGDWMSMRAKTRIGIDITTAQHKHKNLARMASLVDSYLMTADQSEASDRILKVLIEWLMPQDLFEYMVDITPSTIRMPDGTNRHTYMMAPAGNGYIFPLQTILFFTLAYCTCKEMGVKPEVYSYGDDLIAPAAIYTQLHKLFDVLSLKMNPNKTFRSGSARESCGGDYLLGSDVRPLYVKNIPHTTTEWYAVINGIRRVGRDNNSNCWRTNHFRRLWLWCISNVHQAKRLCAPIHYGDCAIGTDDERLYRLTYKKQYLVDGKRHHYPNGGLWKGIPYSGWYVTINVTKSAGKGETYPQHTKGVKQKDLLRITSLDSVVGAGDRLRVMRFDQKGNKLSEPLRKFVYSPFFHRDDLVVEQQQVPLIIECPAPNDNMDDLFSLLGENNPICDTNAVIDRVEKRHQACIVSITDILRRRIQNLESVKAEVKSMDLNF